MSRRFFISRGLIGHRPYLDVVKSEESPDVVAIIHNKKAVPRRDCFS